MVWKIIDRKSQARQNTETGEVISRRQYDKLTKPHFIGYKKKAEYSKAKDPNLFYARPAKGRKSAVKAAPKERELIVEARKEFYEEKAKRQEQAKVEKQLKRKTAFKANKRVHQNKIRIQALKPDTYGFRVSFDSYEGYEKALEEIRAMGSKVEAYSVGLVGHVEKNNKTEMSGATLYTMMHPRNKPISEDELYEDTEQFTEEHTYFIFLHWFIYVAINKELARERTRRYDAKYPGKREAKKAQAKQKRKSKRKTKK